MRIRDIFKIALHNLRYNFSRTALTVIIVAIVSSLIMTICLFGTTFYRNVIDVNKMLFGMDGTEYTFTGRIEEIGGREVGTGVSEEEILSLEESVKKYAHIVNRMSVNGDLGDDRVDKYIVAGNSGVPQNAADVNNWLNAGDWMDFDADDMEFACFSMYNLSTEGLFYEGRGWTPADADGSGIWMSLEMIDRLEQHGLNLQIGDVVTLAAVKDVTTGFEAAGGAFTLEGIFYSDKLKANDFDNYRIPLCILSAKAAKAALGELFTVRSVSMRYYPSEKDYDYNAIYADMSRFTKEVNEKFAANVSDGEKIPRFSCSFIDTMRMATLACMLVMGVVVFLAAIILFLSVGSVANTVIISVDKDRKFIGLLKALGLRQRGVTRIVTCQSLCMIVAGVAIGVSVLFLSKIVVISVIDSLITAIAGVPLTFRVAVNIPVLLPVLTAAAFFAAAFVFSRGSLQKIAKQDVIGTINEVA